MMRKCVIDKMFLNSANWLFVSSNFNSTMKNRLICNVAVTPAKINWYVVELRCFLQRVEDE